MTHISEYLCNFLFYSIESIIITDIHVNKSRAFAQTVKALWYLVKFKDFTIRDVRDMYAVNTSAEW